jgi:hypothetical protein
MAMQSCWTAAIAGLIAILSAGRLGADTPAERSTLKGLTGLRVLVDSVPPEVAKRGLRSADLQAEIEARLKAAAIPLLTADDRAAGNPTLHLSLAIFADDSGEETIFSYWRQLTFRQETRLTRAPAVRVAAITWQASGALATVSTEGLKKFRDDVRRDVDLFVAAYREANRP